MLEYIIGQFNILIKPIQELTKDKRELKDNALRAISHAINETRIYYAAIERGAERNFDIEAQLAKYWSAASIPIRHIDNELAMACDLKCDYWINPDEWTSQQIKEHGIALNDLHKAYRSALFSSARFRKTVHGRTSNISLS